MIESNCLFVDAIIILRRSIEFSRILNYSTFDNAVPVI